MPCTRQPRRKKKTRLPATGAPAKVKKRHVTCPLCPFTSSSDISVAKHFFKAHWERKMEEHGGKVARKVASPESGVPRSVISQTIRRMFNKYSHKRNDQRNIDGRNKMVTVRKIVAGG